ncbi:LacI family DNA-binding transcriptional regulator [Listeria monocytogenes]|nr:LacI family transcriptional regulator [Listeria monocytogenes]EJC2614669.1 LacI family DNA-binding transcriptional regulator [Listeria monocytogenes]EJC2631074.1 LacI family DNA-binding transcriptional regulator [Listeria monocytogenes]EJC2655943.1 LacI family DNA-binding transcriptional regulator [Listeria monocytogenes]EJE4578921.1 LacI family DNA-binding transcriptional regulator [Listeria monocytogenes]
MNKVTKIGDVAEKTGYSITTISRAINGNPNVSDKTKKKIFAAMKELNYYPNNIAQQFRGQGTKMIGVVISFITNPFFAYLVDAIERYLSHRGYQVVMLQTLENPAKELQFIEMLQKKQLDGLIMANLENDTEEIKSLVESGKIVLCNRYLGNENLTIINIDETKAAYQATNYLIKCGYKRLAYCTGGIKNKNDYRFKGFMQAVTENGLSFDESLYFEKLLTIKDGEELLVNILEEKSTLPDAIFSNGDTVAAGILYAAKKYRIAVPEELGIIGFDNQPIAEVLNPALTTIEQPIKELGEYSAQVLLANLQGTSVPVAPDLETKLIIRETTK